MCILERVKKPNVTTLETLHQEDFETAVEVCTNELTEAKEDHHKRAELLVDRSQAFLSLGKLGASRHDAEDACKEDKFFAPGHFRRAVTYQAMGKLELAQEAAMQALLLEPTSEEYFFKVQDLTHDIGRTDFGLGPSTEQLQKEMATSAPVPGNVTWTDADAPEQWYRKPTAETMEKSLPYTILHSLELAIHARLLRTSVLTKGRLCIHLAGCTSEMESHADFKVLFDKLPHLEELQIVQVGYLGIFGPCKSIIPDPHAPPTGKLITHTHTLGNGRRLLIRQWKGLYHDFLARASRHEFDGKGYLHEKPDLVLLANPRLDFFFDCWAPTLACLREANYLTVVTGGNLDHSRRHHNLVLQSLGVKIVLRMRTSRFGIAHGTRSVKNHNLMAFRGSAPLPPGKERHICTGEDYVCVRRLLKKLGVELETEMQSKARLAGLMQAEAVVDTALVAVAASRRGGSFSEEGGFGGVLPRTPCLSTTSSSSLSSMVSCSTMEANNMSYESLKDLVVLGGGDGGGAGCVCNKGVNNKEVEVEEAEEDEAAKARRADEATNNDTANTHSPTTTMNNDVMNVHAHAHTDTHPSKMVEGRGGVAQVPGWSCRSFRKGADGIYAVDEHA